MTNSSDLIAVVYSEFDNQVGPQIAFQFPEDELSREDFDAISDYVIVAKHLCEHLISVCVHDVQVLSYPICIEDEKYDRNALFFTVSFVLSASADSSIFEMPLKKIAYLFRAMEHESEFLFRNSRKPILRNILHRVYTDLRNTGECALVVDRSNMLNIKLYRSPKEPDHVFDHQVPVLLEYRNKLINMDWDISVRNLVQFIDGVKSVARLALDAEMDIACLKRSLRMLLFYKAVVMIDLFQFSNIYELTDHFSDLLQPNSRLLKECQSFAARPDAPAPTREQVLSLFGAMHAGVHLRSVIKENFDAVKSVDIRRFVGFGVIRGVIRRVHEFPICTARSTILHGPASDIPMHRATHTPHSSLGSIASNQSLRDFLRDDASLLRSPMHGPDKQNRLSSYIRKSHIPEHRPVERESSFNLAVADADVSLTAQVRESMRGQECLDSLCCRYVRCKEELLAIATQRLPMDTTTYSASRQACKGAASAAACCHCLPYTKIGQSPTHAEFYMHSVLHRRQRHRKRPLSNSFKFAESPWTAFRPTPR